MGKGDKKSKKGKIRLGSYGNSRRRNSIKAKVNRRSTAPAAKDEVEGSAEAKPKKTARKKAEA